MNDIYLRFHERWILFAMRLTKSRKVKPETAHQLVSYGLIAQNHLNTKNEIGEYIPAGTYHLTDKWHRYRIFRRRDFFHRLVTPITVTVLTTIVLQMLEWLIQWLLSQR